MEGSTIDALQEDKGRMLNKPQVRVWYHPHKVRKSGDDDYHAFGYSGQKNIEKLVEDAKNYIQKHGKSIGAEDEPLIAYKGREFSVDAFFKHYPEFRE